MSDELSIPSRLVQQVLQTMIAAHLVIEVSGLEPAYTPGRPLEQITAHHILQAMRARGQELLTRNEPVREEVYGEFARIQEAEKHAASSITMLALVHRAEARLELTPPPPSEKETGGLPELVPATKPPAEPGPKSKVQSPMPKVQSPESVAELAPEPKEAVGISKTVEGEKPVEPGPQSTVHSPQSVREPAPKPPEPIVAARPIAEPVSDEERDFPL
jgi:hypothetical protein